MRENKSESANLDASASLAELNKQGNAPQDNTQHAPPQQDNTQHDPSKGYSGEATAEHSASHPNHNPHHNPHSLSLSLGYYAVGELSIGRRENALYAYRLLNEIEKNEMRWRLGRAFCALELNFLDEARSVLENMQPNEKQQDNDEELQKLLERCLLRLEYMQKQQEKNPNVGQSPNKTLNQASTQSAKSQPESSSNSKVIPFPNSPNAKATTQKATA